VTSTPMPSPSINGMIGRSGTRSDVSSLIVIASPPAGGAICSYLIANSFRLRGGAPPLPVLHPPADERSVVQPQSPGDQHSDLHRLFVVEARIDLRLVRARQIRLGQPSRAAGALRDVVAGQLEVDAAEIAAELAVDAKRCGELVADIVEAARLFALGRRLGIAVHRVAYPKHL